MTRGGVAFFGLAKRKLMGVNAWWLGPSFVLRWMWLRRTDANRPWKNLDVDFGKDSVL